MTAATARASGASPRSDRLELSAASIRQRLPGAFVPRPALYWCDVLASALLGWSALAVAVAQGGWTALLAQAVATLALYRAVLFIHELTHLRAGAVPGLEPAWNLLVGAPLQVPSLMYVGSHGAHHRRSTYGTDQDPEYAPIAHWSRLRIITSTLVMGIVPLLLVIRWGLLGPLSRLLPPLRPLVVRSMSTLVINVAYQRPPPGERERWRWDLGEALAGGLCWLAALALARGWLPLGALGHWYALAAGILVLNHFRTLAAHRYESLGERLDVAGQLVDSVNIPGIPGITVLVAPVGLRYHGLHHWLPSLPYHSMGRVHRALRAELPSDSPYHRIESGSITHALRELLSRAGA